MANNGSDQQILDARDFSEARVHSDPNGRVRLVHLTADDAPDRLPADVRSWFTSSRAQRTVRLAVGLSGGIMIFGTLIVLLVLLEHWWIAVLVVLGELAALIVMLRVVSKSSAPSAAKLDVSELSFIGAQPQTGTVVRVWPKFYEGDFVDLAIAVELTGQRAGERPLIVTAGETAGPRDEVVKLLPDQLPREGDTAWVWCAGIGGSTSAVATAIQVAVRRPGQV